MKIILLFSILVINSIKNNLINPKRVIKNNIDTNVIKSNEKKLNTLKEENKNILTNPILIKEKPNLQIKKNRKLIENTFTEYEQNKNIKKTENGPILTNNKNSKDPKNRKLLIDSLMNGIETLGSPKNLLGNGLSYVAGMSAYDETAPTYLSKTKINYLKEEINTYKSKLKIALMDRGQVIHDMHHLVDVCEEKTDEIRTSGLNAIYGIEAVIESSNKKQSIRIKEISDKLKKH